MKKQLRISRNLNESKWLLVKRLFWAFALLFKAASIGLRGMRRQQMLSSVTYKGARYAIINWPGNERVNIARVGEYHEGILASEIQDVITPKELAWRFTAMWRWYMGSWYEIDVQRRLYTHNP